MKKSRNVVLAMYIVNFCILVAVLIKVMIDREPSTEYLIGAYFGIINFIEIIIIIANLKKIKKKKIIIVLGIILLVQIAVTFITPAYRKYYYVMGRGQSGKNLIPVPAVLPSIINAYGISI